MHRFSEGFGIICNASSAELSTLYGQPKYQHGWTDYNCIDGFKKCKRQHRIFPSELFYPPEMAALSGLA